MNQQTIYKIFIFVLLLTSYGCIQKIQSKNIEPPEKIDSVKRPKIEAKTKTIIDR